MSEITQGLSYRRIGQITRHNHETVRRYMTKQVPSVEFVRALCTSLNISADWLLLGRGAVSAPPEGLGGAAEAGPAPLGSDLRTQVESVSARLHRVEAFLGLPGSRGVKLEIKPVPGRRALGVPGLADTALSEIGHAATPEPEHPHEPVTPSPPPAGPAGTNASAGFERLTLAEQRARYIADALGEGADAGAD
ncbi:MAG: hypothetical protein C0475_05520 [Planctomyces sp.]|nr:hypothetical protein [Planctomyces sp.]